MVPFYLSRLDDMLPPRITGLSTTISETYRRHVWVTASGMFDRSQFEFINTTLGADRILGVALTRSSARRPLGYIPFDIRLRPV